MKNKFLSYFTILQELKMLAFNLNKIMQVIEI